MTRTPPSSIRITSPYQRRFFLKRMFFHKRLFGPALDHAIVRFVSDACVRLLSRDSARMFSWVEIETINRCNSTCAFCPVNKKNDPRPISTMTDSMFTKIIDELAALDFAGDLSLHSNNEPLLDEHIVERIRYARKKCPKAFIFIYTNGMRLTTDIAWSLIQAGIDLIKINNYNDRLRLNRNIRELVEDFENPPFSEHASKIRIVIRKLNEVLSNRGGISPNKLPGRDTSFRYFHSSSCRFPFSQLVIRPDGKVSLCSNDAYGQVTMGEVAVQSLVEIWNSEKYRQFRTELTANGRRNLTLCSTCDDYTFDPRVFLEHSVVLRSINKVMKFSSPYWK